MSDRLLKESDVLKIAFQLPLVVNSVFANAVKALPSADRPQGRWIYDRYDSRGVNRCSECGVEIKGYGENIPFPNCPYCLARMKGAEDE